MKKNKEEGNILHTSSIVSSTDFTPQVQFEWNEMKFQLTPNEARDLAIRVFEAADAAESDAFVASYLKEKLKVGPQAMMAILIAFREYREERKRKDYLPR